MSGNREYYLNIFQDDKNENLSTEIRTAINTSRHTTGMNANRVFPDDSGCSRQNMNDIINLMISEYRDMSFDYRQSADEAGQQFGGIYLMLMKAIGHPVSVVDYRIEESNASYQVVYTVP